MNNKKFTDTLSTRSKNGISRCFGRDALDKPEVIAEACADRLKMTVGVGPKSLQEIAELLYEFGYVDDPYTWLGEKIGGINEQSNLPFYSRTH